MKKKRRIVYLLLCILLVAVLAVALSQSGFFESVDSVEDLQAYISRWAPFSQLVFFGIQFASVILAPIPSSVTAAAGALMFGVLPAFLLTTLAVILGSIVVFSLARQLGQDAVERFLKKHESQKYVAIIRSRRDTFLVLAFLLPFFPDDIICILAGLTEIPFRRFVAIISLTRPWGLLVSCIVGGNVHRLPPWGIALVLIGGLILCVFALRYGNRIEDWLIEKISQMKTRGKKQDPAPEQSGEEK